MVEVRKYSMVDAGRLALTTSPVRRSSARDEILLGAACLWCRDLTAPTIRAIGGAVGRSPVTVLAPFGSALDLYAQVMRAEWDVLENGWYCAPSESAWTFLRGHIQRLSRFDRVLLRLPALVHASLGGAVAARPADGVDGRTAVLYLLAAHATSSAPLDTVLGQLRRIELDAAAA